MNLIDSNENNQSPMLTAIGREMVKASRTMNEGSFMKLLGAYLSEPDLSDAERLDLNYLKRQYRR